MPLTLLAALLAAAPSEAPSRPAWAIVTRAPANASSGNVRLEFGTLGAARAAPPASARLAYFVLRTAGDGASRKVSWADSRTCRALTPILAELREIPTPRIDLPGFPSRPGGTDEAIVLDGITYRLRLFDDLQFSGNIGSPLARWTETALKRLEPCWAAKAPRDVG